MHARMIRSILLTTLVSLAVLAAALDSRPARAQEAEATVSTELSSVVEQARRSGSTVVIITPSGRAEGAGGGQEASTASRLEDVMLRTREEFASILANSVNFTHSIGETLRASSPSGSLWWLARAIIIAIAGLLVGVYATRPLQSWGRKHFRHLYKAEPSGRSEKILYLLFRALMGLVSMIIVFAVAVLVAVVLDDGHEPTRHTILVIVAGFCAYRTIRSVVLWNMLAPDVPSHRMLRFDDEAAQGIQGEMARVAAVVTVALGICIWMDALGLERDAHKLSLSAAMLLSAVLMGVLVHRHRKAVAGAIASPEQLERSTWRRLLAQNWHTLALAYLAIAWVVSFVRLTLDLPSSTGLNAAPLAIGLMALVVYAIALVMIDKFYEARIKRFREVQELEQQTRAAEEAAVRAAQPEPVADGEEMVVHKEATPEYRPVFKELLEHGAAILVAFTAVAQLAAVWGVEMGDEGNPVTAALGTLAIVFIAYLAYKAVNLYVDRQLEGEDIGGEPGEPGEEMSGTGATRLATLLPIFRSVLVVTIFVIAGMIVLSELGVNIGPLFAGAGVIGLAVGFGAQTLIRDIFSGAFFLIDDAFRKGEYVELDNIRGTVERISMRSFQLRHHNGPLHTIPFGEIRQLTNYSRDWVMMKLPLRVTYDTDVDQVRKLIKKLGQKLLEHPEVGDNFLQPLKSQGVFQMEDSAMIIRVKFMTRPGDQFVTRKVVYQEIRNLFEREGIKFAHREVTVRLADGNVESLSEREKQAVSAAARSAIEDGKGPAGPSAADAL